MRCFKDMEMPVDLEANVDTISIIIMCLDRLGGKSRKKDIQ